MSAIRSTKDGVSDCTISAGNTGALMIAGRFLLGMLAGIDRPAIASLVPNEIGESFVLLDLGANIGCTTDDLLQFTIMGAAFGNVVLNKTKPRVGLLNIGEEEIKGNDTIKNTYKILKHANLDSNNNFFNFIGYIEPTSMCKGNVDVVVCDGFAGNIVLKSMEGAASIVKTYINKAFRQSWITKLGYFLVKSSLKKTMHAIDPRTRNGGMFMGLGGVLVKSHGSADEVAFSNSVLISYDLIKNNVNQKIIIQMEEVDFNFSED